MKTVVWKRLLEVHPNFVQKTEKHRECGTLIKESWASCNSPFLYTSRCPRHDLKTETRKVANVDSTRVISKNFRRTLWIFPKSPQALFLLPLSLSSLRGGSRAYRTWKRVLRGITNDIVRRIKDRAFVPGGERVLILSQEPYGITFCFLFERSERSNRPNLWYFAMCFLLHYLDDPHKSQSAMEMIVDRWRVILSVIDQRKKFPIG